MKEKKPLANERKQKAEPSSAPVNKRTGRFGPRSILSGSFLEKEGLIKQLPFILYVTFLFLLYIANSYYGEKTVYKMEKYKSELIGLRSEYISAKTRLMTAVNLTKVNEKLSPREIHPSHTPPGKIFVDKK